MDSISERLKEIQLEILDEFAKICDKHDLLYFALGGTTLGAIRHKGFIPWDDDIDVGLPREDYEKFLSVAQNELPNNMFLQTYKTDPNYPHRFAKIRVNNTTFIEKSASNIRMHHGVYMDIFPLDGYPGNIWERKAFHFQEAILKIAASSAFYSDVCPENAAKEFLKKLIIKCIPYQKAVRKLDKLYHNCSYQNADIIANYCGAWGSKEIMPKEIFANGTTGIFEGRSIRLPKKTDTYLKMLYGDYMTPPPPEKRVSHHYCTVIDLEKSYKNYMK